jgi:hypothetical protein
LSHDYLDKNEIAFQNIYIAIKEMLDAAAFGDSIDLKIHHFTSQQNTIDENFRRINERLTKLESLKNKKHITKIEIKPPIADIQPEVADLKLKPYQKIEKYIKLSSIPLSCDDISKGTGLTYDQVQNAIRSNYIKKNTKVQIAIKPIKYGDTNTTRNLKVNMYSWIGNK